MAQESVLRIGVDSSKAQAGVNTAEAALRRLASTADRLGEAFNRMQGKINTLDGNVKRLGNTSKEAASGANLLHQAFAGLSVAIAAQQFVAMLDAATNMDNRLRLVTNTAAELNAVYNELLRISLTTRTSIATNASLYNRFAFAMKGLSLTYREQIAFVESLNEAVVISGATEAEAAGALLQLSQGLGAGALRGQELNSVMEQIPKVASIIAGEMGVTIGQLRKMGEEGKITTEIVLSAFKSAAPKLAEEFTRIKPTISSAFVVMQTKLSDFVHYLNTSQGIGATFAGVLLSMADNINILVGAFAALATVITIRVIPALIRMAWAFATNPIGAITLAVTALGAELAYLAGETYNVSGVTATGGQIMAAAWRTVGDAASQVWDWFKTTWLGGWVAEASAKVGQFASGWRVWLGAIWGGVKLAINLIINAFSKGIDIVKVEWGALPAFFELLLKGVVNLVAAGVEKFVNLFVEGLAKIGYAVDYFIDSGLGDAISQSLTIDLGRMDTSAAEQSLRDAGKRLGDAFNAPTLDYFGGGMGVDFSAEFNKNLKAVTEESKKTGDGTDVLGGKLNNLAQNFKKAGEGADSLAKTIQKDFDAIREAQGGAVVAVEDWHTRTVAKLNAAKLAHSKYAEMLETVFLVKLQEARIKDVENTAAWANGLTSVQRGVAEKIRTEWQQLTTTMNGNTTATQEWYAQEKRILEAAGLQNSIYAQQVEQIYSQRLIDARKRDLQNATDWASGVSRALVSLDEQYGNMAKVSESIFTSAFDKMSDAITEFVTTGKLDFRSFATSVIADIARIIVKMMLLNADRKSVV